MSDPSLLTRTLSVGSYGKDVDAAKRVVYRALDQILGGQRLKAHMSKPLKVRRTFGPFFRSDVNKLRDELGFLRTGKFDKVLLHAAGVRGYPDALAVDLFNQYADEHKPVPKPPALVEPKQGFNSLVRDLWADYTTGRNMGLSDLGTYNPTSKLPSGRYSDHATSRKDGRVGKPACAFDLGFSPAVGYSHPTARAFFHQMCGRPEIEYVILGTKIWSVDKGLHYYGYGGHEGHVHVSGHRR